MSFPRVELSIRVFLPGPEDKDAMVYQNRRVIAPEWLKDSRYKGYATFYFEEMYDEMVESLRGQL
jgi:hypothetical protein